MIHIPVLQKEVIEYLDPKKNENFIDCTFGGGGHSSLILSKTSPKGKVLGIEADSSLVEKFSNPRVILVNDSYINIKEIVERENFYPFSGILFDLGISSWHIDESKRGFSFLRDEPLDMRYSKEGETAKDILNNYSYQEIERIIREYGEERFSKRIARKITERRNFERTEDLLKVIRSSVPLSKGKIHYATRTFQALRIAVNDELENIKRGISSAIEIIPQGGRIVVISFHSLEDRIVKNLFKDKSLKLLTKKVVTAQEKNPRARSAKLRAVIKL